MSAFHAMQRIAKANKDERMPVKLHFVSGNVLTGEVQAFDTYLVTLLTPEGLEHVPYTHIERVTQCP